MKPLTIEQLKALEVGDWVWVELLDDDLVACWVSGTGRGFYCEKIEDTKNDDSLAITYDGERGWLDYSDYGTVWVAYKNKEMAESKGDLYKTAFELILQDVFENRLQADILSCSSCPFMFELFGRCESQGLYEDCKKRWQDYYLAEAERRLAELTKE